MATKPTPTPFPGPPEREDDYHDPDDLAYWVARLLIASWRARHPAPTAPTAPAVPAPEAGAPPDPGRKDGSRR